MPSGDELKHIRHPFRRHPAGREARRRLTPARLEPRQLQEPRTLARSCGDGERSPSPNGALAPAAREPGPHSALGQDDMLWEGPPRSLEVPPAKGATAGEACRGSTLGSGQRAGPAVRRRGGRIQPLPQNSCTFTASPFPSASTEGALLVRPPQGGGDIILEAARRDTGAGRAVGGGLGRSLGKRP